jgi:biotin carboxyl carrier protein
VKYEVMLGGKTRTVEIVRASDALAAAEQSAGLQPCNSDSAAGWKISLDGQPVDASVVEVAPNTFSILLNGDSYQIRVAPRADGTFTLHTGFAEYHAEVTDPRVWRGRKHGALEAEGRQQIAAPMPGKVVRVLVSAGDAIEAGQGLLVVEAMKMQNEIRSPKSGKVEKLFAKEGQAVVAGEVLAWVE